MTTFAATVNPAEASVYLEVTGAPAGAVVITRTDANGTTSVRLREDQEPIAGYLLVQDYEAALVGSVAYELVDSAAAVFTDSVDLGMTGIAPRVHVVQLPSVNALPRFVSGYDASRSSSTVVHWPVDRGDPVVIVKPARTREGTLTCHADSYADAAAMMGAIVPGRLLMLRQGDHPGLDMYFAVVRSDVQPVEMVSDNGTDVWVWSVVAQFVEVKSPPVPLLGEAGWTFEDVTAGYADFAAVRSAFDDFAALTIGP
jgi:hypothetical protein